MFKVITSHLGISPFLYYDLTYRELDLMMQGYLDKKQNEAEVKREEKREEIELYAIATRVGYFNAMNNTNYKVFEDENEQINEIDPVVKESDLNYLKKLFS